MDNLCFDFTTLTNPELSFWYHMFGAGMGTLSVEVSNDGCATWASVFSLSGDQGATWGEPVQIVDQREGYDAICWGPGFEYGQRGGIMAGRECLWLDDGSLLVPFTEYERLNGKPWFFRVVCARGHWREDGSGLDWYRIQ